MPARTHRAIQVGAALAVALASGCAGQLDTGSAAAQPRGGDAGAADAGPADSGTGQGSPDAGADAGAVSDAGAADAGTDDGDAGTGEGSDAGVDAGADGGVLAGGGDGGPVFTPIGVSAAVAKVKTLLVGLPPSNDEVAAVAANPAALKTLVDQWVALPQYDTKMRSFFATAFQQTQVTANDFADQGADADDARVLQALRESFARTAQAIIAQGRPFTDVLTTRSFMLTPRLMSLYAFVDTQLIDDNNRLTDTWQKANPTFSYTMESSTVLTPAQSLDSTNAATFMQWYNPNLAKTPVYDAACPTDNIVYAGATSAQLYFGALRGQGQNFNIKLTDGTNHTCVPPGSASVFAATDFTTWQMVNVRPPVGAETPTRFYDLPALRNATELVLNVPRVSYFTTPAFFAAWQTNQSNVARVTLNQTLIVGLGKAIDPSNTTAPMSLAALDQQHAAPGTACYACHQSLDPMRQFFRQTYSLHFHQQTVAAQMNLPPQFAFHDISDQWSSIFDLGAAIAGHPMFTSAWTQKLCTYATSAVCDQTDPEFQRIANAFQSSNYSWRVLVRELFSSPLVTYRQESQTADTVGQTFPLTRRDHLCAALSSRLPQADICGLDVNTNLPPNLRVIKTIASVLPSDQYSRGAEGAVLANDPSLVFRTGTENICAALAQQFVDTGGKYQSTAPDAAIGEMVHTLMGITGDRDASRIALLTGHFSSAKAAGETASDALKSTFVLACLSPSVVGVGQ